MKEFYTIARDGHIELDIKKSRFLCFLKRVSSEEEARELIASLKKEHHKARHHCSAFILNQDVPIKRSSDDGEPSGTAGIPMLTVLENHNLTNLVAVVVRYFGGVKLGAGGLVRAYSGAVSEAIQSVGLVLVTQQEGVEVSLSYAQYQHFQNWCLRHQLQEQDTTFSDMVKTTIFMDMAKVETILADLVDFYQGAISYQKIGQRSVEIPVVERN